MFKFLEPFQYFIFAIGAFHFIIGVEIGMIAIIDSSAKGIQYSVLSTMFGIIFLIVFYKIHKACR